jgi:hypothetical protein
MMTLRLLTLAVAVGLATAGCGGEGDEEGNAEAACDTPPVAMTAAPTLLPDGFPTPTDVTYTSEEQTGPSTVVDGYYAGDIESAYDSYKQMLDTGGYAITKSEKEEDDAEVNFTGGNSTGQVKLLQECADRTTVTITSRPE